MRPEAAQAKLIPLATLLPPEGGSSSLLLPAGVPLRSYSLREFRFTPGLCSWKLKDFLFDLLLL